LYLFYMMACRPVNNCTYLFYMMACRPVNNAVLILYDGMSACEQCCTYSIWWYVGLWTMLYLLHMMVCRPVNNAVLTPYGGMSACEQCCTDSIWECCKIHVVQYYKELWAASNIMAVSELVTNMVHGSSVNVSVWNIVHVELIR